jgi:hypothetical protein
VVLYRLEKEAEMKVVEEQLFKYVTGHDGHAVSFERGMGRAEEMALALAPPQQEHRGRQGRGGGRIQHVGTASRGGASI